jgi:putative zinc finger/helix-turn-helix YgiT family protein
MNRKGKSMPKRKHNVCPACGVGDLAKVTGEFKTQIEGPDGHPMILAVPDVTWRHCGSCGEDLLDHNASEAISRAHRAALRLLGAEEIRSVRQRLAKTQAQMCELLGIGEKTYSRWESGTHFQSEAFDRYLRLLQVPEVLDALNEIRRYKQGSAEALAPEFEYVEDVSAYKGVSESNKRTAPACWFAMSA